VKRYSLAVLALAVVIIMPASAQNGVPVRTAIVVVSEQDDIALQSMLAAGGSPSGVLKTLETAGELLSSSAPHVWTDTAGRFALDAPLSPGIYNVTAFAPGFVSSSDSLAVDGSGAANLTIFMQPSAMVSGHVTDKEGKPIPGIVVAASSPHSINYDITMDDGVFVLDTGLKTGQHEIYIFKPGIDVARLQSLFNDTGIGMLENKVPSFLKTDSAGYVSRVSKVQLEQGKFTTLNVQLDSSHVVSGRVTDSEGNPVSDVVVFAFDSTGAMINDAAVTDSDGRYTLDNDLASGTYTITIPSLFGKGYAPASAAIIVPEENAIDFVLDRSGTIAGRVTDTAGNPIAGATIFAVSKGLNLNDTQLAEFLVSGAATTKTDQDGMFTIDSGIGNGTYTVTASFGSVPVTGFAEVQAGGSTDIILDFVETITIKGRVTDGAGRPLENAMVAPSFASKIAGAGLFAVRTGPDGTYELAVPLKDNSARLLFDEVVVSADGYKSATANSNATVVLEEMPAARITGIVMAQKPLSPPVETVLTRNGTVVFEHEGTQYDVGLLTNARVLDAAFDPIGKSISIELEGVLDAAGRSQFLIPKEFMGGPFVVSIDGKISESAITAENQTHTTIAVEHDHDLREVTIQGATAVPEFPLPVLLAAAGIAATVMWKRLRR
jgi:protocatechuate 3,4-dioxygenase beta subunit